MRRTRTAPDMESFRSILKSKGLKATPQRIAVHAAMLALGHASADLVYEHIKKEGTAEVTVASVYNILSGNDMKKMIEIYNDEADCRPGDVVRVIIVKE